MTFFSNIVLTAKTQISWIRTWGWGRRANALIHIWQQKLETHYTHFM